MNFICVHDEGIPTMINLDLVSSFSVHDFHHAKIVFSNESDVLITDESFDELCKIIKDYIEYIG